MKLEDEFIAMAWELRERGWAIAMFSPDEIPGGKDEAALLEDSLVAAGREYIDALEEEQ